MRYRSLKRAARDREAKPFRDAMLKKYRSCWICGHSPTRPWRDAPRECSELCVHEIAGAAHREAAQDKAYAVLVLCWLCNEEAVENRATWPQARQLALLKAKAPDSYDLKAFNHLVNPNAPNRITEEEVEVWYEHNQKKSLHLGAGDPRR